MKLRQDSPVRHARTDSRVRTELAVMLIRLMPLWLVILGAILAACLFLPFFGKPIISFSQKEETSVSDLLLTEVKEVCRLNAAEFHYKVVFPFDFQRGGVSDAGIRAKVADRGGSGLASLLNFDEQLWLSAQSLAKRSGLKIGAPEYQFLVADVIIKGGWDLAKGTPVLETATRQENGKTIRSAVLTLPPASVTSVTVEDPVRERYPFPELALSPEGWKAIAAFIRENCVDRSLRDGLLEAARGRAEAWIRPLLTQAGYDEITVRGAGF